MDKELRKIIKEAKKWGYETQVTKKGHVQFWHEGRLISTFPGTGSDYRGNLNALSFMKRHNGFQWPPRR